MRRNAPTKEKNRKMNAFRKTITLLLLACLVASMATSFSKTVHAAASSSDPISVYVGYADNLRPSGFFPNPWQGSPNTVFIGGGGTFDAGAVRIDNTGSSLITIDSVSVDLQRPGPVFNLWGSNIIVPAGFSLILTQSVCCSNFDTSDSPFEPCGVVAAVGQSPFPAISVTIGGVTQRFNDTAHVLDTLGYDLACQGNESQEWRPIGTFQGNPEVTVTPFNATSTAGTPNTVTATVIDNVTGVPVPSTTVNFTVTGANTASGSNVTNTLGQATFTYTPTNSGTDTITASAIVRGVIVTSPPVHGTRTTSPLSVTKFFTDSSLNPLPLDSNGNPKVDVVLAGGRVRSTNPGQVLAWVNITNTSPSPIQSLKLNDTLPVDWVINSPWKPALGAIHVYFASTTSLATNPEITQPSTITVSTGNPETVHLAIPLFNATAIGHPLMPGQSILLSVKLTYGLMGTAQPATSYPRNYTDTAVTATWTQASFTGTESTGSGSAFFIADAKVVS